VCAIGSDHIRSAMVGSDAGRYVTSGRDAQGVDGVVLSGTGGVWAVRGTDGVTRDVSLRGRLKLSRDEGRASSAERSARPVSEEVTLKLAVGDVVTLTPNDRGDSWSIAAIHPRRSQLSRRAPGGAPGERIVAANVDQVVVVFAMVRPEPHVRMLDRFLVIAEGSGIAARIVVNKVDLAGVPAAREVFGGYERIGYPLHFTSTRTRDGLDALHASLRAVTSVLSGPSGVGKSSLINAMYPGLDLRVGEISASVNKGRHTTVGALAHPLPDGGYVVDTPGLREIGLWGLPARDLASCFPEMRVRREACRFGDCRHVQEPGCAVLEACADGTISAARYESYLLLLTEAVASERRW